MTKIPTIAADSGLYISNLPNSSTRIICKTCSGVELTDDEMIEYYSNLVKSVGGSSEAYYLTGLALVNEDGCFTIDIEEDHFILTNKVDIEHKHRSNPLDVITIDPVCGKYYSEMSNDDFKNFGFKFEEEYLAFIKRNNKKIGRRIL